MNASADPSSGRLKEAPTQQRRCPDRNRDSRADFLRTRRFFVLRGAGDSRLERAGDQMQERTMCKMRKTPRGNDP
jgi:hypothetical protein